MYELKCPGCGRHLMLTDAPPGYRVMVPCRNCKGHKTVRTGETPKADRPSTARRPDPLRYR